MKASELREKPLDELKQALESELEAQFKLRIQASTGQLKQTHLLKQTRRNIARLKTCIAENRQAASDA